MPIRYVYEKGIMNGTGNGQFSPDQLTTRGELVTILYRIAGEPQVEGKHFPDVVPGAFYEKAVSWASGNGIVTGYEDGRFGPNDIILREQLLTILYRYTQSKGIDTKNSTDVSRSGDFPEVSPCAVNAITWAAHYDILPISSNKLLYPKAEVYREYLAYTFYMYLENVLTPAEAGHPIPDFASQMAGEWQVYWVASNEYDKDFEDFSFDPAYMESKN